MRKRTVTRETLYSQVSWDYIPELGQFLSTVCITLVYKWEESISMGTTSHQEGMFNFETTTILAHLGYICVNQCRQNFARGGGIGANGKCQNFRGCMINQTLRRLNKAKQSKSTRLRKSFFQRKIGCLRWDSNPRHSAL